MERNYHPVGENPFMVPAAALQVTAIVPVPQGVRVTYQDDHTVLVPADGTVALDVLRNGHDELPEGGGSFCDVLGAACLVDATLEQVNQAIRDIRGYTRFFQSDKTAYKHTWYTRAEFMELAKHPAVVEQAATNESEVTTALQGQGYFVPPPESNLLDLQLTIGHGNLLVKSEANPKILTTCYRVHVAGGTPEQSGDLVAILNENAIVEPDKLGGAQRQNAVWVLEPIEGKGTLVRYYFACLLRRPAAALVKDDRWEMSKMNVSEYVSGIRLRALAMAKAQR
jgi:hypothetical protein